MGSYSSSEQSAKVRAPNGVTVYEAVNRFDCRLTTATPTQLATTQAQNRIDLLTNGLNGVLRINEKLPVAKADEEDIGVPVQASGVVRSVDLNGTSFLNNNKYVVQRVEVIFFLRIKLRNLVRFKKVTIDPTCVTHVRFSRVKASKRTQYATGALCHLPVFCKTYPTDRLDLIKCNTILSFKFKLIASVCWEKSPEKASSFN